MVDSIGSFGFHVNEYNDDIKKLLLDNGCQIYQCFIEDYNKFLNYQPELKPIIHSSFYINIASDLKYGYYLLKKEIKFCLKHKVSHYVLHIGKCTKKMKISESECIRNMLKILKHVCKKFKLYQNDKFNLCLEMLSGESNDLLYTLTDLNKTLFKDKHYYFKNLKICLDTCHIFASGVDISTTDKFDKYIKDINKTITINKIGIVHLNNSFYDLDSRKDKHADFDNGQIPTDTLVYIFQYLKKRNINIIIELKNIEHNLDILNNKQ